jgi:RNA polymerase sigma-70 factor (ECF subfamily)
MPPDADGGVGQARAWLAAARDGDDGARGRLLDLYRAYLLAIANGELTSDLRTKAAASDVVQDTLLEAHGLFARFEGAEVEEFRAWLRGILLNKLTNLNDRYYGSQKRELKREQSLDVSSAAGPLRDRVAAADSTPSARAVRTEEEERLHAALARLPERVRQVIIWRAWDKLSFAAIAERLGNSEDAARMYHSRAIARLEKEMARGND